MKQSPASLAPAVFRKAVKTVAVVMLISLAGNTRAVLAAEGDSGALSTKQLLQLGTKQFAGGDRQQAASTFRQVLSADPHNADALFNLGALAEGDNDFESAQSFYKQALQATPSDRQLQEALTSVQTRLNEPLRIKRPGAVSAVPVAPTDRAQPSTPVLQGQALSNSLIGQSRSSGYPVVQVGQAPAPVHKKRSVFSKAGHLLNSLPEPLHCPICAPLTLVTGPMRAMPGPSH